MIKINCKNCNNEVYTYPSRIGRKNFCSHKCNINFNRVNFDLGGQIPWNKGKHNVQPPVWNKGTKGLVKAWNKGIPMSEEIKRKVSISKKGSVSWNKGKPHLKIRGDKHPQWKGGITPINHKIRTSLNYKLWRTAVFERDNWTCQECKKIGGTLNAHHIKPFAWFPELRFEVSNGRTLCVPCHKATGTYGRGAIYRNKCIASA